jgi:acetylornithine deacetylase/succinyl-diaminopimelate desuccinylase-like protein
MAAELSLPDSPPDAPPSVDPAMDAAAARLVRSTVVAAARDHLVRNDARTLEEQVRLTEIPAPPFGEEARGRAMAGLMVEAGLERVETDGVGNVLGWYGRPGTAPVVVAAHLDTVFPEGTDVAVRRVGDRLVGPGIGDDGRGLAAILALARALRAAGARFRRPLLVAATVGEEGRGDLRGVRHLFGPRGLGRFAAAFVSLDGAGSRRIVNRAVGARRWRATVRGPGGHSWVDWGVANPLHALGRAVSGLDGIPRPPGVTLSVGRLEGGRSVNAIPEDAWMELEIRSPDPSDLEETAPRVEGAVARAVEAVNRSRRDGTRALALEMEIVGDRPAGCTAPETPLVQAAAAATRSLGRRPLLALSSTDANVPMSLGIPAVTMGAGGEGGQAHTLEEWYRNRDGPDGILRAVLTLLLVDPAG